MNKQTRTEVEARIRKALQTESLKLGFAGIDLSDQSDMRWAVERIVETLPDVELLSLGDTQLNDDGLRVLAEQAYRLSSLKTLEFFRARLSDEGLRAIAEHLHQVPSVESLDFSYTPTSNAGVRALAEQVRHLPALQFLGFRRTQMGDAGLLALAEQAEAEHLSGLQSLLLEKTRVGDTGLMALVAQAKHLPRLQFLQLTSTQVSDVGLKMLALQARHLSGLQTLAIGSTEVSDAGLLALAGQARHFKALSRLDVSSTHVRVPKEIHYSFDPSRIFEYVLGREKLLPEVKLLLVGQGEAGKTHLRKRLFVEPADPTYHEAHEKRTHDIEMTVWTTKVELKQESGDGKQESKETEVLCRVWDFGGQDELHGSHRFFVGAERCLYLLVLNATQDDKQNRLDYWLRLLAHHGRKQSGSDVERAPVLIVLTQCDTPCDQWGEPGTADNGFVHLINALTVAQRENWYGANVVACIGGFGWSDAVELLTQAQQLEISQRHTAAARRIVEDLQRHSPDVLCLDLLFNRGFFVMKKWIEDLFTHDPAAPVPDAKSFNWRKNTAFQAMCEEAKISEGLRESYLAICRNLGLVHWVGDVLEIKEGNDTAMKELVFNPEWVKGPVYELIQRHDAHKHGWMSNSQFRERLLAPQFQHLYCRLPFEESDFDNIQNLMLACRVAFRIEKRRGLADGLLIPDLLDPRERPHRATWTGDGVLRFFHPLDFLPERVFLRFIADHYKLIKDHQNNCYRDQVIVPYLDSLTNTTCEVLVQSELCPPPGEQPYLDISIRGGDPARKHIAHKVLEEFKVIFQQEELARGYDRRDESPLQWILEEDDNPTSALQPELPVNAGASSAPRKTITVIDGEICCGQISVHLTRIERLLFEALWRGKNKNITKESLFDAAYHPEELSVEDDTDSGKLQRHLSSLRKKLESLPERITLEWKPNCEPPCYRLVIRE